MTSAAAARGKTAFSFVLVTLMWGSTWLVIKGQIAIVAPTWTVTWRFVLACLGMV
ncbi:MAG TPA: EamA family transporter, partial [Novosphingobium sp.]|nr:EamA family transporter [Novosphingobium sp.]